MEGSSWKPRIVIYKGAGGLPYSKTAVMSNAHSIIVAHNHPSGHCQCSPEDVIVSEKLVEIGKILNIEVLDSLIVSHKNGVSLKKQMYI